MRDFSTVKRIVIKVGTSLLTQNSPKRYIELLAEQIRDLYADDKEICVVSSGAIGLGAQELGITGRIQNIVMRQACASVGQPVLMHVYKRIFHNFGIATAQVLLTREVLTHEKSYKNFCNTVERLFVLKVLPVLNENDCVATAEIGTIFGDNDQLSAYVAGRIDADILILLSDVDGYYSQYQRNAQLHQPVSDVWEISGDMIRTAGEAGSDHATGGMVTKLKAASIAMQAGCQVIIANGKDNKIIPRLLRGEVLGTLFHVPAVTDGDTKKEDMYADNMRRNT